MLKVDNLQFLTIKKINKIQLIINFSIEIDQSQQIQ